MTSPATAVSRQFGRDLRQIGATSVRATAPDAVTATFVDNFKATQAAFALRDTLKGVKLVIDNKSLTCDMPHPSVEGVTELLSAHRGVTGFSVVGNKSLEVFTQTSKTADRLRDLLRPELPNGTTVDVSALGKLRPESA